MTNTNDKSFTSADLEQARREAAAQAVAENNTRVQAVTQVLAGYPDLLQKALADPACNETAATALLVPVLRAENDKLKAQVAEKDQKLALIAQGGGQPLATEPLAQDGKQPDAAGADGLDDGQPATFQRKVDELVQAGVPEGAAMQRAGNLLPKAHAAWTNQQ